MKTPYILLILTSPICCILAKVEIIEILPDDVNISLKGKEADAKIGDFVLRNEFIEYVVRVPAEKRKANTGAFGGEKRMTPGCLYDLCIRGLRNDQLTIFSPSRQQGEISYIRKKDIGKGTEIVTTAAKSGGLYKNISTLSERQNMGFISAPSFEMKEQLTSAGLSIE